MIKQSAQRTAVAVAEPRLAVVLPTRRSGEQRRAERMPARLLIRSPNSRKLRGHTRDVSSTGTFVETSDRPAIGSQHEISITVSEKLVPAIVQVARHAADGVGLTFMAPSSPLEDVLSRLMDEVIV